MSSVVNCSLQREIDKYWEQLSAGEEQQPCGWLKFKYRVSWQVVPVALADMLSDPDPEKSRMLQMGKLDIKGLEQAYKGE